MLKVGVENGARIIPRHQPIVASEAERFRRQKENIVGERLHQHPVMDKVSARMLSSLPKKARNCPPGDRGTRRCS